MPCQDCTRLRAHVAALAEQRNVLQGSHDALYDARESLAAEWGIQQIDLHHLRAHVAALVAAAHALLDGLNERPLRALLDAPDLAALAAETQARDAVVEAARRIDGRPILVGSIDQQTRHELRDALARLDAARSP